MGVIKARRGPFFALVFLPLLASFALFWSWIDVPFLLDDLVAGQVLTEEGVLSGERVVAMVWPTAAADRYNDHFRPVGWLSISLDAFTFGFHPRAFHLTALLLHGMNGVLVALLARRLLPGSRIGVPVFAGLLFVAWPGAGEPVIWVAHRFTLLSTFFFLLAALGATESRSKKGRLLLVFMGALLALLSKDSMLSQLWVLPPLAFIAGSSLDFRRGGAVAAAVAAAFFVGVGARFLCTGSLVPRLNDTTEDVVQGLDVRSLLNGLPETLARAVLPVRGLGLPWWSVLVPLSAFVVFLSVRRRGVFTELWRPIILLVLLLGASFPVLSVDGDLAGSRHLYLAAIALSFVFVALVTVLFRGRWTPLVVLVFTASAALHWNGQNYALARDHVQTVARSLRGAAGPGDEVVVTGLPSTVRGAPLFGPRVQHLPLRFRPPLATDLFTVSGNPPGANASALIADTPSVWIRYPDEASWDTWVTPKPDVVYFGGPDATEERWVSIRSPREGSVWPGKDGLVAGAPLTVFVKGPRDDVGFVRVFVSVAGRTGGLLFALNDPAIRRQELADGTELMIPLAAVAALASRESRSLFALAAGGGVPGRLIVSFGASDRATAGHLVSPPVTVTLGAP